MTNWLTDDFNRANSTTVVGSPSVGGPYTQQVGTWGISGNTLYTSASTANSQLTFPAAINLDLSATFVVSGGSTVSASQLMFRWVDVSNFWMFGRVGTGLVAFTHVAAGVSTQVTASIAFTDGQALRVVAFGKYLYGFIAGVLVATVEDQYYASAGTPAGFRSNSNTSTRIDDASAVDATTVPSGWGSALALYKGRDTTALDLAGSV